MVQINFSASEAPQSGTVVEAPRKNLGGPPKGSANAIRHGLQCGKLPKNSGGVRKMLAEFQNSLERIVVGMTGGELSIVASSQIASAVNWERHRLLATRWLAEAFNELKPDQRINFSREAARASSERDKCLKGLVEEIARMRNERPQQKDGPLDPLFHALESHASTIDSNPDANRTSPYDGRPVEAAGGPA